MAYRYIEEVCAAIVVVIKPLYMRKPTKEEALQVQERFAARRGIGNVGAAVNGTHVPWQPDSLEFMEDFHNYKGWYSILVVAVVNNFYMFVDSEVGNPGRMSDPMRESFFFQDMKRDREGWLGPNELMITDGAFSSGEFVLTPFPGTNLKNLKCFSTLHLVLHGCMLSNVSGCGSQGGESR